jgi:hypothetical protein
VDATRAANMFEVCRGGRCRDRRVAETGAIGTASPAKKDFDETTNLSYRL